MSQDVDPAGGRPPARSAADLYWFVAAALAAALALIHARDFYHDDAYITLRYVSRLLSGRGLTWTGSERVEGFTHPLWLGQLALLGALHLNLEAASRALGLAYAAGLFALWWRAGAGPLPLLLVMVTQAFAAWARAGLETSSFCLWLVAGAWWTLRARDEMRTGDSRATRSAAFAGGTWALAALTRPEGLGCGVIALAGLADWRRRKFPVAGILAFAAPLLLYGAFRLWYFGDLLPNAARAKIEGIPWAWRWRSAMSSLISSWTAWAPAAAATTAAIALKRRARPLWIAGMTIPIWGSIFLGGGDHMPWARLVTPAIVLLAFAAATPVESRAGPRARWISAGALVAAAALHACFTLAQPIGRDWAASVGAPVGRFLETNVAEGSLVVTATAGATPYFAPSLEFLDPLGLTDRHIARRRITEIVALTQRLPGHLKGDGAYVLERAPDVIILGPGQGYLGEKPAQWFLTDLELLLSPEFQSLYRPFRFNVPITAEEAAEPGVGRLLRPAVDPSRRSFALIAYLRDSPAGRALADRGTPLVPPWVR